MVEGGDYYSLLAYLLQQSYIPATLQCYISRLRNSSFCCPRAISWVLENRMRLYSEGIYLPTRILHLWTPLETPILAKFSIRRKDFIGQKHTSYGRLSVRLTSCVLVSGATRVNQRDTPYLRLNFLCEAAMYMTQPTGTKELLELRSLTGYPWCSHSTHGGSGGNEDHLYTVLATNLLVLWYLAELSCSLLVATSTVKLRLLRQRWLCWPQLKHPYDMSFFDSTAHATYKGQPKLSYLRGKARRLHIS